MKNVYLNMSALGFTPQMIKTYQALDTIGYSTASTIADHMRASRSNLYATLRQLEQLGFVQKVKTDDGPAYFRAVRVEDALDTYMAVKKQAILELIRQQRGRRSVL